MERQIKRAKIFKGRVIEVVVDDIIIDEQKLAKREVVLHNGGVAIALKNHDGKFFMVRQYRYAANKEMLEFCAGKLEKDEDPKTAIERECHEELGYTFKNLKALGSIIPTCGYCSERIYLFYAEADNYIGEDFDEDERIEKLSFTYAEIEKMIKDNLIDDAKTLALMYRIKMEGLDARD